MRSVPPEVLFTLALLAITEIFSLGLGLPFVVPAQSTTAFVGVHYFVPLFAVLIWYGSAALFGGGRRLGELTIALICYAVVMWLHFTLKLWGPHINSNRFDSLYWAMDQQVRPLIDACFWIRHAISARVDGLDHLYLLGFMALFFISFCMHSVSSPAAFRKLLLAAILLQGLGALAYLIMPALGPFLYEKGASALATDTQSMMLDVYRQSVAGGPTWIAAHGSENLAAGLAAMPSLHSGGSFLFLWFAWRYERPLLVLYIPLFAFICVEAIASRWHYVIDLPVGIALARLAIALAFRFEPDAGTKTEEPTAGVPLAPQETVA